MGRQLPLPLFFFFNDTATTEIYTLSLHDALPICATAISSARPKSAANIDQAAEGRRAGIILLLPSPLALPDRKSTRLNSSHSQISYAVFCLKKKKKATIYIY